MTKAYQKLAQYTPGELLQKLPRAAKRRVVRLSRSARNRYVATLKTNRAVPLARFVDSPAGLLSAIQKDTILNLASRIADHKIDLLGSGWVSLDYGIKRAGFEGKRFPPEDSQPATPDWARVNQANKRLAEATAELLSEEYRLIDWQVDIKSGFRWSVETPSYQILDNLPDGADIKLPWELGRLNHLPILAIASALDGEVEEDESELNKYAAEFRNQVIDFVSSNPPGYGVNWCTATIAGIRTCNLLLAYDLFRAQNVEFDAGFDRIISSTVRSHAEFIRKNLEWWDLGQRNNHYLANIAGLAFAAAYLPRNSKTNGWLRFAGRHLEQEVLHQFNDDGSSYESSTAYHAFSLELVSWTAAIIIDCMERWHSIHRQTTRTNVFGLSFWNRLARAINFLQDTRLHSGDLLQIGDNDSGRLFKLNPVASVVPRRRAMRTLAHLIDSWEVIQEAEFLDENVLDYSEVHRVVQSLSEYKPGSGDGLLTKLVWAACSGFSTESQSEARPSFKEIISTRKDPSKFIASTSTLIPLDDADKDLEVTHYPDFGLVLFRSPDILVSVVCKTKPYRTLVGHPHDDQMSITIEHSGIEYLADPGTYVYTPSEKRRNQFRSSAFHCGPQSYDARSQFDSIFKPPKLILATLERLDRSGIRMSMGSGIRRVRRTITFLPDGIEILDESTGVALMSMEKIIRLHRGRPVSNGYGKLRLPHSIPQEEKEVQWNE